MQNIFGVKKINLEDELNTEKKKKRMQKSVIMSEVVTQGARLASPAESLTGTLLWLLWGGVTRRTLSALPRPQERAHR